MTAINLIPPRVGFVRLDPNGEYVLTREGFLFLRSLFQRVGGATGSSITEVDLSSQFDNGISASLAEFIKQLNDLKTEQPQDNTAQVAELIKVLQDIKNESTFQSAAEIAELKKQIEDLQHQIDSITDSTAAITEFKKTAQVSGSFGCNGATAQTAYVSGGALAAYGAGANGFDTAGHASALYAMVVSIRAALVADGIMS